MPVPPLVRSVALGALALLVAACQDPSGVGLGVLGEEGGDPSLLVIVAAAPTLEAEADLPGGFADGSSPVQTRVLVGAVMDPVFGDVETEAYFDLRPPGTVPNGFLDRTITSATLRFPRDYVYGDSTTMLDLALYEMANEWDPIGAPADTTFEAGDFLADYSVSASDTLYTFDLPDSWVDANEETLRSDSITTALDGFQLRLADGAPGGAVVGLDVSEASLRVVTAEDTVDFPLREVFSRIERGAGMAPAPDRLILRDGAGEVIAFEDPFEDVEDVAIARAVVRLSVDTNLLDDSFLTRPLPSSLTLFGVTEAGDRFGLASAMPNEESGYGFTSTSLTNAVQSDILGTPLFVRYEVGVASSPASLGVLPLILGPAPGEEEDETRLRFILTVVPT